MADASICRLSSESYGGSSSSACSQNAVRVGDAAAYISHFSYLVVQEALFEQLACIAATPPLDQQHPSSAAAANSATVSGQPASVWQVVEQSLLRAGPSQQPQRQQLFQLAWAESKREAAVEHTSRRAPSGWEPAQQQRAGVTLWELVTDEPSDQERSASTDGSRDGGGRCQPGGGSVGEQHTGFVDLCLHLTGGRLLCFCSSSFSHPHLVFALLLV